MDTYYISQMTLHHTIFPAACGHAPFVQPGPDSVLLNQVNRYYVVFFESATTDPEKTIYL